MKDRKVLMLGLVLLATLPVIVGIAVAGLIGLRHGVLALWYSIVAATCVAVAIWGLQASEATPAMQRFGAAVPVYAPALLIGGGILALQGLSSLTLGRISLVALLVGAANVFLAQFFFVWGCVANLWECP